MPTLDANCLLSDPAPIWFDGPATTDGLLAALPDPLQAALAALEAQARRPALAAVPPPPADPLAQALPWLVRHLGVAAAVEAVVGPVDDDRPAASDDVLPALRRIGFDAHLQRRSLSSFSQADLPTVLMLHSGDACVLTARWRDEQGQAQCNLVLPGPQPDEFSTAESEIEAEYSGVALVVSRPARPPLASALARARAAAAGQAGAGGSTAGPAGAADAAPMAHAEALVALAAAVQGAQRAMQATRAEAAPVRPGEAAAKPLPLPLPGRAAVPLVARAAASGPDDDPAAVLKVSFMQSDRAVISPGQTLSRMAHDARALVRITLAPLRRQAVAAMRALGQCARAAGRHLAGLAKALATGMMRVARQGAQSPARCVWRCLRRVAFLAHQRRLDWRQRLRQRQLHRQALAALGPAGLSRLPALASAGSAEPASAGLALPTPAWIDQAPITAAWPEVAPVAGQPIAAPLALAEGNPAHQGMAPRALTPWAKQACPAARARHPIAGWRPRLGTAAQRLAGAAAAQRVAWLPGLAGASALCLLVGAPQAWASMVSSASLQALWVTPQLLRGAFSANLELAGQALAAQGQARRVAARNRIDCELGQPVLAAAGGSGRLPELAAQAESVASGDRRHPGVAVAEGQGAGAALATATAPAVRGRGMPRRARHACR